MTTKKLGQEPAFACANNGGCNEGMSKRFYAATKILCALISNADRHSQDGDCEVWNYEHLTQIAFKAADELLKQENE